MKTFQAVLFAASLVLCTTSAFAQDNTETEPAPNPPPAETRAPAQPAPNALDLDADGGFVIIGKEHLPDFTVLIDREDLSKAYDLELDERFLPKIIEAVGKDPF